MQELSQIFPPLCVAQLFPDTQGRPGVEKLSVMTLVVAAWPPPSFFLSSDGELVTGTVSFWLSLIAFTACLLNRWNFSLSSFDLIVHFLTSSSYLLFVL